MVLEHGGGQPWDLHYLHGNHGDRCELHIGTVSSTSPSVAGPRAQGRGPFGRASGGGDSPALSAGDSTSRPAGSAMSASGSPACFHSPMTSLPGLDHIQRGWFVVLAAPAAGTDPDSRNPGGGGLDPALAFHVAAQPRPLWLAKVVAGVGEGVGEGSAPGSTPGAAGGLKLHLFARAPGARHFAPAVDGRGYPLMLPTSAARPAGRGTLVTVFESLDRGRRGGGGRLPRAVLVELAERGGGVSGGVSIEEAGSGTSEDEG